MNRQAEPGQTALIVLGMHRSGTSATTGALQCLGVQLGKNLYSGHRDVNAKGYFEHGDIADTNDEALQALGSSWDDVLVKDDGWWRRECLEPYAKAIRKYIRRDFSRSPVWAVKDPRVCRMLPWWLDILAAEDVSPYFLFVLRSPADVFRSLERRDGFSKEKAALLWVLHYLEAERWTRGHPRTFMDFDRFIEAPQASVERVAAELRLAFPTPPREASACLGQLITPALRHHQHAAAFSGTPVLDFAADLYQQLLDAVEHGAGALDRKRLDAMQQRMKDIQGAFPVSLVEHLRDTARSRGGLRLTLNRLMRSWSWYTGKPVRFVERGLGRDV
jgi:hypothetical protein